MSNCSLISISISLLFFIYFGLIAAIAVTKNGTKEVSLQDQLVQLRNEIIANVTAIEKSFKALKTQIEHENSFINIETSTLRSMFDLDHNTLTALRGEITNLAAKID